jgi:hypothetical protein
MTPPFAASQRAALSQRDENVLPSAASERLLMECEGLQIALRQELGRPAPDLTRARALKAAIAKLREKIAIDQGEPPPHTD